MSAFRFDCIFYYVRDLDRAIAFYATVLGFRLSSRDAVARFNVDGVRFELVPTVMPACSPDAETRGSRWLCAESAHADEPTSCSR